MTGVFRLRGKTAHEQWCWIGRDLIQARKQASDDKLGFIEVAACCSSYYAATLSYIVDICGDICASGR